MKMKSSYHGAQTCFRSPLKAARDAFCILVVLVALHGWSGPRALAQEVEFSNPLADPLLLRATSRLAHGVAGVFDLKMPLSGEPGVECRTGESSGVYSAVFAFDMAVTSGRASIVDGAATAGAPSFSGNEMSVPLTAVENAQFVIIRVEGVNGSDVVAGEVIFGFLAGDADADGDVDGRDFLVWQRSSGVPVNARNFRVDLDNDGLIDVNDRRLLLLYRGTSLP